MQTVQLTAKIIDYCLIDYLSDHHRRDGELLIGAESLTVGDFEEELDAYMDESDYPFPREDALHVIGELISKFDPPVEQEEPGDDEPPRWWLLLEF